MKNNKFKPKKYISLTRRSGTRGSGPRSLSVTRAASRRRAPPWWPWPARRCTWPDPASPCRAGACLVNPWEYKDIIHRYTCRVATFLQEYSRHHTMTVFGQLLLLKTSWIWFKCSSAPGTGPFLSYKQVNQQVILSCRVDSVFPEPEVDLMWTQGMTTNKEDNFRFRETFSSCPTSFLQALGWMNKSNIYEQSNCKIILQLWGNDLHHQEGEPLHREGDHNAGHLLDLGHRDVPVLHLPAVHPQHGCGQDRADRLLPRNHHKVILTILQYWHKKIVLAQFSNIMNSRHFVKTLTSF